MRTRALALAAGVLLTASSAQAQPRYVVVNLGILAEAPAGTSEGWSINAGGTVAGASSYNPATLSAFRGVVANDQGMTALVQPLAGGLSRAHEINDSGQVAGWDRAPGATDRRLPVLWTGGIPTILNTLPQHTNALALSLNTQGVAVGQSAPAPSGGNGSRAVVWNGVTPTDLGTLGGQQSLAQGINDAGQIVGFSFLADGSLRATLWENGSIVNLGSGGNFSYATAINNKGQIVGSSTGPFNPRAYLWDHGTMTNIDPRGTGGDSIAYDINELGSIVGEYRTSAGVPQGFLWYFGQFYDLTDLLHPSSQGWTVQVARGINDAGQITGRACQTGIGCRAVRLDPVYTQYLAEGATSSFFDTQIALLNPGDTPTTATMTFLPSGGVAPVVHTVPVPARTRATVNPKLLPGLATAEFSTVVESDELLVVDRTMSWDSSGYGSHAETAVAAPATTWYLAEGATLSGFDLFYLLQNPAAHVHDRTRAVPAPDGRAPREGRTCCQPHRARTSGSTWRTSLVWVRLSPAPTFSAVVESLDDTPIIVERAMYLSNQGRLFNAGHESAGVTTPSTQWFLAEGATGTYFDLFVLIANPNDTDGQRDADGTCSPTVTTFTRAHGRARQLALQHLGRRTSSSPACPGSLSPTSRCPPRSRSTNGVPISSSGRCGGPATPAPGTRRTTRRGRQATGTRWALAEGEVGGVARARRRTSSSPTRRRLPAAHAVTLLFEDGTSAPADVTSCRQIRGPTWRWPSTSREAQGRRFGASSSRRGRPRRRSWSSGRCTATPEARPGPQAPTRWPRGFRSHKCRPLLSDFDVKPQ